MDLNWKLRTEDRFRYGTVHTILHLERGGVLEIDPVPLWGYNASLEEVEVWRIPTGVCLASISRDTSRRTRSVKIWSRNCTDWVEAQEKLKQLKNRRTEGGLKWFKSLLIRKGGSVGDGPRPAPRTKGDPRSRSSKVCKIMEKKESKYSR